MEEFQLSLSLLYPHLWSMDFMLANHPNSCKWVCIQDTWKWAMLVIWSYRNRQAVLCCRQICRSLKNECNYNVEPAPSLLYVHLLQTSITMISCNTVVLLPIHLQLILIQFPFSRTHIHTYIPAAELTLMKLQHLLFPSLGHSSLPSFLPPFLLEESFLWAGSSSSSSSCSLL